MKSLYITKKPDSEAHMSDKPPPMNICTHSHSQTGQAIAYKLEGNYLEHDGEGEEIWYDK